MLRFISISSLAMVFSTISYSGSIALIMHLINKV